MTDATSSDAEPTDGDLIARWRAGDERAATALVKRHADALARFAASLGVKTEIEELVQDTFVRAFQSLEGFRGESAFRTWLFTIERRLVLDRRRAERRRPEVESLEESDAATAHDQLEGMLANETERRIREAIERLSPMQRQVFSLRVGEGLSYKEIAEVADTTEGAARVHYHNAVRAVKEFLDE
jgi:RNA polymerase sigma-70 factor (ECF subfamily)